jgi:hypothetical protein
MYDKIAASDETYVKGDMWIRTIRYQVHNARTVFRVVTQCGLVGSCQCFGGTFSSIFRVENQGCRLYRNMLASLSNYMASHSVIQ